MKAKQSKDISRRLSKIITQNIYGMFCETHTTNKHKVRSCTLLCAHEDRRPNCDQNLNRIYYPVCCAVIFGSLLRGADGLRRDQFCNQNDTPITYGTVLGYGRESPPYRAKVSAVGTPPCFSSPSKWIFSYGWLFGLPFFCFNRTVYQRARRIGIRIRIPSFGTPCLW